MSRCRNDHAFMDEPCTRIPPARRLPMQVATGGGRWLLGERKWRLAAIFEEADVDDGWEKCCRDGSLCSCSSGRARNETPLGAEHALPHVPH